MTIHEVDATHEFPDCRGKIYHPDTLPAGTPECWRYTGAHTNAGQPWVLLFVPVAADTQAVQEVSTAA